MTIPLICHFLIGPPGCGKSTLANLLTQINPNSQIISTDQIRLSLFGDESIQGDWSLIEEKVISQIQESIQSDKPVIYDATNVKKIGARLYFNRYKTIKLNGLLGIYQHL